MAKKKLGSIVWPNLPNDTYILDAGKVEYSDSETYDAGTAGEAIQKKANLDGYYENLTAGSANQLLSTVTIEDKVPYQFRTSGGSADIGDRETDMLVGGTVAWNQLAPIVTNTNKWTANTAFGTFTTSGNALVYTITVKNGSQSITIANTAGGIPIVKGHKIFTSFYMTSTEASSAVRVSSMNNQWVSMPSISANTKTLLTRIYESDQDTGGNAFWGIYPNLASGLSVGTVVTVEEIQVFDLTQMFGSTIADYIYSLEQSTAGAGVAWFKKLFPKPYYAYDAGTLKSVEGVSSHDMVGFNAWDEVWEQGRYNEYGEKVSGTNCIRSVNYIPFLPNTAYYFCIGGNIGGRMNFYDADKNFIATSTGANTVKTTPANCAYVLFSTATEYGGTYKNDICINLSWDGERDGEYEPYVKQSYPLDDSLTLRGIPKLDSANSLYYDGDTYESDGTVTRKYGIVDLGTLTWLYSDGFSRFYSESLAQYIKKNAGYAPKMICSKYPTEVWGTSGTNLWLANNGTIYINDSAYSDATSFKTAMSGVYLVYELATPTTETADPYTNPQIVDDFGTEEYVTTSLVPVGHVTQYQPNLRAKLEMAPNSPDGDGDYIVRQTNGQNEYVPLVIEDALPATPSEDGTYNLKVTVADGVATLSWGN